MPGRFPVVDDDPLRALLTTKCRVITQTVAASSAQSQTPCERLLRNQLGTHRQLQSAVRSLGEAVGKPGQEFAIEDLFPDDYYLRLVQETYRKDVQQAGLSEIALVGTDQLCKRIEWVFESAGIVFNKGRVAKVLRRELSRAKAISDIPNSTADMARRLIAAVVQGLPALRP